MTSTITPGELKLFEISSFIAKINIEKHMQFLNLNVNPNRGIQIYTFDYAQIVTNPELQFKRSVSLQSYLYPLLGKEWFHQYGIELHKCFKLYLNLMSPWNWLPWLKIKWNLQLHSLCVTSWWSGKDKACLPFSESGLTPLWHLYYFLAFPFQRSPCSLLSFPPIHLPLCLHHVVPSFRDIR